MGRRGIVSNPDADRATGAAEKSRGRSNSTTLGTPRKRTSSGVFQVEDCEPPKKVERTKSNVETRRSEVLSNSNGRRKVSENEVINDKRKENDKVIEKEKEKNKIIERFDSDSKSACVTTFKESDSWD